jgi:hypothetical protein
MPSFLLLILYLSFAYYDWRPPPAVSIAMVNITKYNWNPPGSIGFWETKLSSMPPRWDTTVSFTSGLSQDKSWILKVQIAAVNWCSSNHLHLHVHPNLLPPTRTCSFLPAQWLLTHLLICIVLLILAFNSFDFYRWLISRNLEALANLTLSPLIQGFRF